MPSITDTVARCAATGVPVLFLDTCSILDVIRAPLPERALGATVSAAKDLLALATGGTYQIVVGSFVPTEWAKNAPGVLRDLNKHVQLTEEAVELFHAHAELSGSPITSARIEYSKHTLPAWLYDLSASVLGAALVLDADSTIQMRAYERVAVNPRRPSRLGGSELKDCTIFEECLEVARQLRSAGFSRKLVFCTSNTKDYCGTGKVAHPDIAADCVPLALAFVTDLPWALSELRTP